MLKDMLNYNLQDVQMEMIHTQTDVEFINQLEEKFEWLRNIIESKNIMVSSNLTTEPGVKEKLDEISNILTNRFGFNIRIVNDDNRNACVNLVTPGKYHVLNGDLKWYEDVKKVFSNKATKNYKAAKELYNIKDDAEAYMNVVYKNILSMERELDKLNLVIDNKNATISGLPSDYHNIIRMDIASFLHSKSYNIKPRNVVATLLHEIGHTFTSIEKIYFRIKNSVTILESVKDSLEAGIYDRTTILRIVSKKLGGNVNGSDENSLLIDVTRKLKGNYLEDSEGQLTRLESERQADQFVVRLGLSKELAEALKKEIPWVRYYSPIDELTEVSIIFSVVYTNVTITYLSLFLRLTGGFVFAMSFTAAMGVFIVLNTVNYILKSREYHRKEAKYEFDGDRVLRLRQDLVRQIRLLKSNTDKDLILKLTEDIKKVDIILNEIRELEKNSKANIIFSKIYDKFRIDGDTLALYNMQNVILSMSENELHVLKHKL